MKPHDNGARTGDPQGPHPISMLSLHPSIMRGWMVPQELRSQRASEVGQLREGL